MELGAVVVDVFRENVVVDVLGEESEGLNLESLSARKCDAFRRPRFVPSFLGF